MVKHIRICHNTEILGLRHWAPANTSYWNFRKYHCRYFMRIIFLYHSRLLCGDSTKIYLYIHVVEFYWRRFDELCNTNSLWTGVPREDEVCASRYCPQKLSVSWNKILGFSVHITKFSVNFCYFVISNGSFWLNLFYLYLCMYLFG